MSKTKAREILTYLQNTGKKYAYIGGIYVCADDCKAVMNAGKGKTLNIT